MAEALEIVTEKLLVEAERKREADTKATKLEKKRLQKARKDAQKDSKKGSQERTDAYNELTAFNQDAKIQTRVAKDTRNHTMEMLGLSNQQLINQQGQVEHIEAQKESLKELEESIKAAGGEATDNKKFNKLTELVYFRK